MTILAGTAVPGAFGYLGKANRPTLFMGRNVVQAIHAQTSVKACRSNDQRPDSSVTEANRPSTMAAARSLDSERMTALLVRLKEDQDETVFAELFHFFAPRLKSYMRKLGAPEDQAEELAQESMAMVWRKIHLFDAERAGASTWIFSIARNLRIDALRRQRRPEVLMNDPSLVPDEPESPEREMDRSQQAAAVLSALATLPAEQARIVHLSFFEDKPHAVIAEQLGIPLGTVKSRMRLAFQRFRKALGEPES
ncbi:sigma-70 family RNA polymerase sigma factor [Dongia sp.]|uniref:sigma-70 family RNA polymerase sigma factor n=1 Tax=Dongia sp. TaxID=1977262 RepID=UPI0035B0E73A